MTRQFTLAAISGSTAIAISLYACFVQYVRPVQAEDDCRMPTWSVTHLPVVGLVCIGE